MLTQHKQFLYMEQTFAYQFERFNYILMESKDATSKVMNIFHPKYEYLSGL